MAPKRARSSRGSAAAPPSKKPSTPHRHHGRPPAPVVPGSLPEGVALAREAPETPHGHLICHRCGRISELELTELDRHLLEELTERRPTGWGIDGVTFSITGSCPRCRRGSP